MEMFRYLKGDVQQVQIATSTESARELFASATYQDACEDACLKDVVVYLRGCRGLEVPPEWRPLIPESI